MKRSPLTRRTRKPRRGPGTPTAPLLPSTPCFFEPISSDPCGGRMDRAHLIPAQRLRALGFTPAQIWDRRVWVPSCRDHHHLFDQGFLRLSRHQLPAALLAYAHDHGIEWSLDRDYGPLPVAAQSVAAPPPNN